MQTGRTGLGWLYWSRTVAICALLAAIGLWLLGELASLAVCVDSCPSSDLFIYNVRQGGIWTAIICVVIEAVAYVLFLVYSLKTQQQSRALKGLLFFVIGAFIGFAILFVIYGQVVARTPVTDSLPEDPSAQLDALWSGAVFLVLLVWSGALLFLQWGKQSRNVRRALEPAATSPTA
jgi:hypothetical protein